jgi:cardiolipin synthase A/B
MAQNVEQADPPPQTDRAREERGLGGYWHRIKQGPRWPWWVSGGIVVLAIFFWITSARTIGDPIVMDYGPTDPAFRDSVGSLLGYDFSGGNSTTTLVNGVRIFPAMVEAIYSARHSVTFETYIWESGAVNDQFMAALIDRARHGVKVHAIVDGAGSLKLKREEMRQMKEAGVELVLYDREHWWQIKPNINHRTHRKILVIDGRVAFTGGVCIADKWYGDAHSEEVWRDTQFRIEGPAAKHLQGIFAHNWLQTTGRLLHGPDYFPPNKSLGDVVVQGWQSGPRQAPEHARKAHLLAIASARESIKLSHAYFVPDDLARTMLVAARQRGVEVEVIVPKKNDSRFGRSASRSRWGPLLEAGVRFYQYEPALYHCKVMIVDDVFVTAGSVNFDNRSFRINDEANINVLDRRFALEQVKIFEEDRAESTELTYEEFKNRPWWVKAADYFAGLFRSQF